MVPVVRVGKQMFSRFTRVGRREAEAMKSTQQLVKDHDEIEKGLKILEAVCDKVEAAPSSADGPSTECQTRE